MNASHAQPSIYLFLIMKWMKNMYFENLFVFQFKRLKNMLRILHDDFQQKVENIHEACIQNTEAVVMYAKWR